MAFKEIIENPDRYRFKIKRKQYYPDIKTEKIKIDSTINNLVDFAHQQGVTYKTLRVHNPWIKNYSLTVKSNKTYTFLIPIERDYPPENELIDTSIVVLDSSNVAVVDSIK